jgi:hypothetical protein
VAIADYRAKVASGAVPDYAAVQRPDEPPPASSQPAAATPSPNGASGDKVVISLR